MWSCKGRVHHCGENDSALPGLNPSGLLLFLVPQPFLIHTNPPHQLSMPVEVPSPPGCAEQGPLQLPQRVPSPTLPAPHSPSPAPLTAFLNL